MKSVQNMNIKAIFFDSVTIRNEAKIKDFILAVKKYGVKTILYDIIQRRKSRGFDLCRLLLMRGNS